MHLRTLVVAALLTSQALHAQRSGNPILPGWYADPEAHVFDSKFWIYPTTSAPYDQQTYLDAFSSSDLVTWKKHSRILDTTVVKWARRAMWAPSIIRKGGRYYLFFAANDIQSDSQPGGGGIGVAWSYYPSGPFKDLLGKPLIDKFHNGAQPIDQMVFADDDGRYYIVYGGWRHCNIARLNDDFTGFVPFADGSTFKEITPRGYVEGAFMLVKDHKYYFMWSEGGWTGPNYAVAYAVGSSPLGPFQRVGKILQQDSTVATGAGHHSVLHAEESPNWYIVYHRRPLGETDRNHRVVSIDELHFDANGMIEPVKITKAGVAADRPTPYEHHELLIRIAQEAALNDSTHRRGHLPESMRSIFGASIARTSIDTLAARLGKPAYWSTGDASTAAGFFCYRVGDDSTTVAFFSDGEAAAGDHLFDGFWVTRIAPGDTIAPHCVRSTTKRAPATPGGLRLGLTRAEVRALLGKPSVELGDLVTYGWFSEDPYPKSAKGYAYMAKHMECFPRMKVPYADVHGAIGIRYVNDRVVSFAVWRSDVSFC